MQVLSGAGRAVLSSSGFVEIGLDGGYRLLVAFLAADLARALIVRPGGLRVPRTHSLAAELSDAGMIEPIDGRDRLDLAGFSPILPSFDARVDEIVLETPTIRLTVGRSPLVLTWEYRTGAHAPFETVIRDRPTQAYRFDRRTARFFHAQQRFPEDHYYGFGEKSGDANKHGRRLRMGTTDALGYDARSSDPLYKHIPFFLTVRPDLGGRSVGLFYDNLARGAFDLGQEIDAYHGLYRSFEADDGDLDFYCLFGADAKAVVANFARLTGRMAFPPRWSLAYSASTMHYTDAADADRQLLGFLDKLTEHNLPCGSFQMSSGYTMIGDKRYVFNWDHARFPDPEGVLARFAQAGVEVVANIKPALLLDHPLFAEVEAFRGFVRDSEDPARPHITQFWGGDGAYLDFTNPRTSAWWSDKVRAQLLEKGIGSTWNDNNEFEIWDDGASVDGNGAGGTIACLRPVQTLLMLRASSLAQRAFAPKKRPYMISRSGGPGMQRYVQTWTGDNFSSWETLRYNLRMGHSLSLSALFNFGHDVGGFAGPRPSPELLMRWIEQGIYWPRFTIHSWNDDGTVTEPWTYPELMPMMRAAFAWRERLVPYLYTLLWRAHRDHAPVLRPLFLDFPEQRTAYEEDDTFLLGTDLLVAPVVEPGMTIRSVHLPETPGGWYDLRDGRQLPGGSRQSVEAPLGRAPVLVRAGAILPLGPDRSAQPGSLTVRLFPGKGHSSFALFDDDGCGVIEDGRAPALIEFDVEWWPSVPRVTIVRKGDHIPRWPEIRFEGPSGEPLTVLIGGREAKACPMP